jgi:hypothetical protein
MMIKVLIFIVLKIVIIIIDILWYSIVIGIEYSLMFNIIVIFFWLHRLIFIDVIFFIRLFCVTWLLIFIIIRVIYLFLIMYF